MSSQPPTSPFTFEVITTRTSPPKVTRARRLLVMSGWILAAITLVVGTNLFLVASKIPIPDMPDGDAPRLDRIEAYMARASAHEAQNGLLSMTLMFIVIGLGVGATTAVAEMTRGDSARLEHEVLRLENQELKKEIEELEKEVDEATASEAETTKLMADIFEARATFRPGGRPPRPFGRGPSDDDDEEDAEPLFPPKSKPPYFN